MKQAPVLRELTKDSSRPRANQRGPVQEAGQPARGGEASRGDDGQRSGVPPPGDVNRALEKGRPRACRDARGSDGGQVPGRRACWAQALVLPHPCSRRPSRCQGNRPAQVRAGLAFAPPPLRLPASERCRCDTRTLGLSTPSGFMKFKIIPLMASTSNCL